MKKLVVVLLCLVMAANIIISVVWANSSVSVYEDFNSMGETPTGWSGGAVVTDGDNKYLQTENFSSSTAYSDRVFTVTTSDIVTIETDIYVQIAGGGLSHVMPISGSKTIARVYFTTGVRADNGTTAYSVPSASNGGYGMNKWNRIKLILNFSTKKYNLYVNGTLVVENHNFADATVTSADKIRFGINASPAALTKAYYDNLIIYEGTQNPLLVYKNIGNKSGTALIDAGFNSDTLDQEPTGTWNWVRSTNGSAAIITREEDDKAVRISNATLGTTSSDFYIQKVFNEQTGKTVIECDMKTVAGSEGSNGIIWVEDNVNRTLIRLYASTTVKIRDENNINVEICPISTNQWHKYRIVIDVPNGLYDLYVDDMSTPKAVAQPFITSLSPGNPSRVRIGVPRVAQEGQTFAQDFDNLKVVPAQNEDIYVWNSKLLPLQSGNQIYSNEGLTIKFTNDYISSSINDTNIFLYRTETDSIEISDVKICGNKMVSIIPVGPLAENEEYELVISNVSFEGGTITQPLRIPFVNSSFFIGEVEIQEASNSISLICPVAYHSSESIDVYAIIAVYDCDILTDFVITKNTLTELSTQITANYIGDTSNKTVKGFVWKDINNIKPLVAFGRK